MGFQSNVYAQKYVTKWIMTGFGFELPLSHSVKIYSVEQIGLLISIFPYISYSNYNNSGSVTSSTGIAFASELGAGVCVNNINLTIRYYTGEPYYNQAVTFLGSTDNVRKDLPVTLLQIMLGYNF
jgi:hypothetical protein